MGKTFSKHDYDGPAVAIDEPVIDSTLEDLGVQVRHTDDFAEADQQFNPEFYADGFQIITPDDGAAAPLDGDEPTYTTAAERRTTRHAERAAFERESRAAVTKKETLASVEELHRFDAGIDPHDTRKVLRAIQKNEARIGANVLSFYAAKRFLANASRFMRGTKLGNSSGSQNRNGYFCRAQFIEFFVDIEIACRSLNLSAMAVALFQLVYTEGRCTQQKAVSRFKEHMTELHRAMYHELLRRNIIDVAGSTHEYFQPFTKRPASV